MVWESCHPVRNTARSCSTTHRRTVSVPPHAAEYVHKQASNLHYSDFTGGGHKNELTITMDDDVNWFYSVTDGEKPAAGQYDFASVLLHEAGHVVGLAHFGGPNHVDYVMKPDLAPGHVTRTIDPDAIHGVRDLYAIADSSGVPEPSSATLLLMIGGLLASHRRNRSEGLCRSNKVYKTKRYAAH
jgi:hypothetical protein